MRYTTDLIPPGQLRILLEILAHQHFKGMNPSIRELCAATGIKSPNGVVAHLDPLKKKGMIDAEPGVGRTIRSKYRLEIMR